MIDDETYAAYRAEIDRADVWIDKQRDRNGWASYHVNDAPNYVRAVSNEMRGAVELYELHRDKPERLTAYTASTCSGGRGGAGDIVTWPGDVLGRFVVTRLWVNGHGNYRRSIRATLPGIGVYIGQTSWESGYYVNLRRAKNS